MMVRDVCFQSCSISWYGSSAFLNVTVNTLLAVEANLGNMWSEQRDIRRGHFDLRYQDIGGPVGSALIEFTGRLVWEPRISFSTFGLLSSRSLYLFASICYDKGPAAFYFNGFRPSNIIS